MTRIQSPVKAIEDLCFEALPSRKKVDVVAAVRVDKTTVFLDSMGRIYSTQVRDKRFYILGCGLDDTLTGCRLLGLLSKEAVDKHAEAMKAAKLERERKWAAESLEENVKTLKIKLTGTQIRELAKLRAPAGARL